MDGVRLQARRLRELQDYIDAQNGGPGKGWFRIVDDAVRGAARDQRGQARRGPRDRGLAAVRLRRLQRAARVHPAQIDRQLDEVHDLGVRDMELVNKFDNALAGVAGDCGTTGVVVNNGNKLRDRQVLGDADPARTPKQRGQAAVRRAPGPERDQLVGNVLAFLPPGRDADLPGSAALQRARASRLGEHLVRRMIDRR